MTEAGKFARIGNKNIYPLDYVLKNIILPKKEIPKVVLLVGPCRSGTTALLKVFSSVVDGAFYQPLKSLFRNGKPKLIIPGSAKIIIIKETLGPWRMKESLMDPLTILLKAGVPKEKIILLPILRDPINAYDSWLEYAAGTNTKLFIAAYLNTVRIHEEALKQRIESIPITYELFKENSEKVMKVIFERLGLKFKESSIKWKGHSYGNKKINLNHEAHARGKYTNLVLNSVVKVGKFKYIKRELKFVTAKDKKDIAKLDSIYKKFFKLAKI